MIKNDKKNKKKYYNKKKMNELKLYDFLINISPSIFGLKTFTISNCLLIDNEKEEEEGKEKEENNETVSSTTIEIKNKQRLLSMFVPSFISSSFSDDNILKKDNEDQEYDDHFVCPDFLTLPEKHKKLE